MVMNRVSVKQGLARGVKKRKEGFEDVKGGASKEACP